MTTLSWTNLFENKDLLQTDFITELRTRIDEDGADFVSDIQIASYIPKALKRISSKVRLIPEFITVTYNSEEYFDMPSSMGGLWGIYVKRGNATPELLPKTSFNGATGYTRRGLRLYTVGLVVGDVLTIFAHRTPTSPDDHEGYVDLPDESDFLECLYTSCELFYWRRRRSAEEIQNSYKLHNEAINTSRDYVIDNYGESVVLYGKKS